MTKFHINSKGVPAPCPAKSGKCPYGGVDGSENHFDNFEDAEKFIQKINEEKHGIITGLKDEKDPYTVETIDGVVIREGDTVYVHSLGDTNRLYEMSLEQKHRPQKLQSNFRWVSLH